LRTVYFQWNLQVDVVGAGTIQAGAGW